MKRLVIPLLALFALLKPAPSYALTQDAEISLKEEAVMEAPAEGSMRCCCCRCNDGSSVLDELGLGDDPLDLSGREARRRHAYEVFEIDSELVVYNPSYRYLDEPTIIEDIMDAYDDRPAFTAAVLAFALFGLLVVVLSVALAVVCAFPKGAAWVRRKVRRCCGNGDNPFYK